MIFLYNEHENFARRTGKPHGYIDYRQVICKIGQDILHNLDDFHFESFIENLNDAIKNSTSFVKLEDYIEFYIIRDHEIFVLVDKTGGIFPLVFYSKGKSGNFPRIQALSRSLEDLKQIADQIQTHLENHDSWNDELQSILQELFTYRSDEESE